VTLRSSTLLILAISCAGWAQQPEKKPEKPLTADERIELLKTERAALEAANVAQTKRAELSQTALRLVQELEGVQAQADKALADFKSAKEKAEQKSGCKFDRDYKCEPDKPKATAATQ
jgi:L-lactate utilization protein LutC